METSSPNLSDDKIEKATMTSHVSTAKQKPKVLRYFQREQNVPAGFTINVVRMVRHEEEPATHKVKKGLNALK